VRVADHEDLVVTELGGLAACPKSSDPSSVGPKSFDESSLAEPLPVPACVLLVPAPSAGSLPLAI
jgi:hypothetical protein